MKISDFLSDYFRGFLGGRIFSIFDRLVFVMIMFNHSWGGEKKSRELVKMEYLVVILEYCFLIFP